jgi:hypothetical protein
MPGISISSAMLIICAELATPPIKAVIANNEIIDVAFIFAAPQIGHKSAE